MNINEIKKFKNGEILSELTAYVKSVEECKAKTGSNYLKVSLQDKTGEIQLQKWNSSEKDKEFLKAGTVMSFKNSVVSIYNDVFSLKTQTGTVIEREDDKDVNDYIFSILPPFGELKTRFNTHYGSITNPELKAVLSNIVKPKYKEFLIWPAAEKMHHDVKYGLLYHTVEILDICEALCELPNYKTNVNKELLKVGAMLHDVGKITEYSMQEDGSGKLTKQMLKGHLVITSQELFHLFKSGIISEALELELSHLVLSHHGKHEYGSPVIPATLEAFILHTADVLSARTYAYLYEGSQLEPGEIADKGSLILDRARVYKPTWNL